MKGKIVIENYDECEYSNTGVYVVEEPYGYEVHINGSLDDDFVTMISKPYDFDGVINYSISINSNVPYVVDFLENFRKNRIEYLIKAEYIVFNNYSLEEISEYIKRNPLLKTKKIIFNVDVELDSNFLNKFIRLFGNDTSNIYFNLTDNSSLIGFNEYKDTVYKIDRMCKDIERFSFSPLEMIMYVYDIVRNRFYLEVDEDEDKALSRDLSSSLLGNKIVCVGYARIFKTLLNKLGIDCREALLRNKDDDGGHARCEIYIKDNKYNVDGVYYFDPTWDSKKRDDDNKYLYSYRYFAMTKNKMDQLDNGRIIDYEFPYFSKDIACEFKEMVEEVGFGNLPKEMVKIINHMSKMINGSYLINRVGLLPDAPEMFRLDKDKIINDLIPLVEYFDKLLSANTLLKVLYNVRKNQFYSNPEKYPFNLNAFYSIVINSGWNFEQTSYDLLLELICSDQNEKKKEQLIKYARDTEMFRNIQQVIVTHTLRKVLIKKNN